MSDDTAYLIGDKVYLRPLDRDDLPHVRRWYGDPDVRGLIGEVTPMTQAAAESWLTKVQTDESRVWFAIVLRENDRLIGECGLLRIFPAWRTSDLSIIIGEKDCWHQGYGREAIILLMDYAFGYLNMHRLAIGVVGFNERALRFYEKVGFRQEGIQRDGYYFNHRYSDFVMMSILEDEFRALHKRPS